jgi:hypothetical protein
MGPEKLSEEVGEEIFVVYGMFIKPFTTAHITASCTT